MPRSCLALTSSVSTKRPRRFIRAHSTHQEDTDREARISHAPTPVHTSMHARALKSRHARKCTQSCTHTHVHISFETRTQTHAHICARITTPVHALRRARTVTAPAYARPHAHSRTHAHAGAPTNSHARAGAIDRPTERRLEIGHACFHRELKRHHLRPSEAMVVGGSKPIHYTVALRLTSSWRTSVSAGACRIGCFCPLGLPLRSVYSTTSVSSASCRLFTRAVATRSYAGAAELRESKRAEERTNETLRGIFRYALELAAMNTAGSACVLGPAPARSTARQPTRCPSRSVCRCHCKHCARIRLPTRCGGRACRQLSAAAQGHCARVSVRARVRVCVHV